MVLNFQQKGSFKLVKQRSIFAVNTVSQELPNHALNFTAKEAVPNLSSPLKSLRVKPCFRPLKKLRSKIKLRTV